MMARDGRSDVDHDLDLGKVWVKTIAGSELAARRCEESKRMQGGR